MLPRHQNAEKGTNTLADRSDETDLVTKCKSGDRIALQEMLALNFGPLRRHVSRQIPAGMKVVVDAADVVQQAYVQVIRDIEKCRATDEASFYSWLRSIADHRLQDAIRFFKAKKRAGQRSRSSAVPSGEQRALTQLVELLSAGSHRPSQSAIRHEAIDAVKRAIDGLPKRYRTAVQLRLIEGKSLDETAASMECSPRAVQGLVDRARSRLRTALGSLSKYQ